MSGRDRIGAAVCAALLAYCFARNAGLPIWRDLPAGDATDFTVLTGLLVWHLLGARK